MSLLWRREERRSISFEDVWGAGWDPPSQVDDAGSLPALFAAHRTIVDTVATTPLHAYRSLPDGSARQLAKPPALITPVHGSMFDWLAQIVASMVTDGNAFGLVTSRDRMGWPTGVVWVAPSRVTIWEPEAGGRVLPEYLLDGRQVPREDVVHIPWIAPPGRWRGISPLKRFVTTLETGALAAQWGRNWFANDTVPPVHVRNNQVTLTPEQAEMVKERYSGAVRGRRPWVTGSDWELSVIGLPPDEQRFIESLKLTAGQVATIYGLKPEDIGGEAANSLTYATVEGNERQQAKRIGQPWGTRIEQALSLHTPRPQYFRFNLDATVRADLLTRMQAHEIGLRIGVETLDEARILEEREPLTPEQKDQWMATNRPTAGPPNTRKDD